MKSLYFVLIMFSLSIFTGCGSENISNKESNSGDLKLNRSNFIDVAKYHYKKASVTLNMRKSRATKKTRAIYPGAKENLTKEEDTFYIKTVTPFNQYIQKLTIDYNNQTINLTIDKDSNRAEITYFDGSKEIKKELSYDELLDMNIINNGTGE